MSEAPENIWAAHDNHYPELNGGQWWGEQCAGTEYTRADLSLAMVAAAYEDAAKHLHDMHDDCLFNDGDEYEAAGYLSSSREVKSRTPDDAKAALAKLIEDAQRKAIAAALIEARAEVEHFAEVLLNDGRHDAESAANHCSGMIRAIDQDALMRKVMEGGDG